MIYEGKLGFVRADGLRRYPKPFIFTGQDYRQVRDMCGISADLTSRHEPYQTPSMPKFEGKGKLVYRSYRWHYTFMTKMDCPLTSTAPGTGPSFAPTWRNPT